MNPGDLLPTTPQELIDAQQRLAALSPDPWHWTGSATRVGAVFVAFPRGSSGPGASGDRCWAAAVVIADGQLVAARVIDGQAGAAYQPGMLFLRVGRPILEAVRQLAQQPDVVLVNGTGRDHPRGAGLAVHLGALLDVPTIGITHRPLIATGDWPADERDASAPLVLDGDVVGYWFRTRAGTRPLAIHAGWRTDPTTALEVAKACAGPSRTPEPLRLARQYARDARAADLS